MHVLPSPPAYGEPWQAHVFPVAQSVSCMHVS
jgi:hypothetical protein